VTAPADDRSVAVMYPGTIAFQRFEYPSRLPQAAQR